MGRRLVVATLWVVVLGSVLLTLSRWVVTRSTLPAVVASGASYALVGFALAAVLGVLLLVRRRTRPALLGTGLAVLGLLANGWWVAPRLVADPVPHGAGVGTVRVLSANLQFGEAEPEAILRAVRTERVDVLVLHEESPPGWLRLRSLGVEKLLPHVVGVPAYTAAGTMVVSRFPLTRPAALPLRNGGVEVSVGGPHPFHVLAVHPAQPFQDPVAWSRDLRTVRDRARAAAADDTSGPTVLAGDFNATGSHRQFRQILGDRLVDAADAAGSGWQPTWPTVDGFIPHGRPVVTLDHVVVRRDVGVERTRTVRLPGSDHLALLAVLRLR